MPQYTRKFFGHILTLFVLFVLAIANWFFPLTFWLGDTPIYRFVWLGIFFIFLDIAFEIIQLSKKQVQLMGDMMSFGRNIKKLEKGFQVLSKPKLPNNAVADYVIAGPSGVWLITAKDKEGKVVFNGDDLVQNNVILRGIITQSLEKSYILSELLKSKLNRDFKIAAVITFISPKVDLADTPNMIRGVYITSRQKINDLIENTDVQILDTGTIEEIIKVLKS